MVESIQNLRENLNELGIPLYVSVESPEAIMSKILDERTTVLYQHEPAHEEACTALAVEEVAKALGSSVKRLRSDATLYHPEDIPFGPDLRDMPDTFTPFKEKVERLAKIRPLAEKLDAFPLLPADDKIYTAMTERFSSSFLPSDVDLGFPEGSFVEAVTTSALGVMPFTGGENAARARISKWMFEDDNLKVNN
jgi:deoxyribodipyrimidine photo-lyase